MGYFATRPAGGGGGGGLPTVEYMRSVATTDFYSAVGGVCPGASSFIAQIFYRYPGPLGANSTEDVITNTGGANGWEIILNFGTIHWEVVDGAGNVITANVGGWYTANDYMVGRDVIFTLRAYQNGGVLTVDFYINTHKQTAGSAAPAAGMTASTGTLKVLGDQVDQLVSGVLYYEGTRTDQQIEDHVNASLAAGDLLAMDGQAATNRWSVAADTPGATWAAAEGGVVLTRNGTMTAETVPLYRA